MSREGRDRNDLSGRGADAAVIGEELPDGVVLRRRPRVPLKGLWATVHERQFVRRVVGLLQHKG